MLRQNCSSLQAEADSPVLIQDVASRLNTRFLWTGLGFAVMMLIGISVRNPFAPHAAEIIPLGIAYTSMPALDPRDILPARHAGSGRARPTGFLPSLLPGARPAFRNANHIAHGGRFSPQLGARVANDRSGDGGDDPEHPKYPDITAERLYQIMVSQVDDLSSLSAQFLNVSSEIWNSFRTQRPKKTRVNVHNVLEAWMRDAGAKAMQSVKKRDTLYEKFDINNMDEIDLDDSIMTWMSIQTIQHEIMINGPEQKILGLAFGEPSEDNIQALASVVLEVWSDDYTDGKLGWVAQEQGYRHKMWVAQDGGGMAAMSAEPVPVVFISELVATPNGRQEGARGELVHGIIAWAEEMGRVVTIIPATEELQEYYTNLGFQLVDPAALIMVYRGKLERDRHSEGRMLDLSLLS